MNGLMPDSCSVVGHLLFDMYHSRRLHSADEADMGLPLLKVAIRGCNNGSAKSCE
jgi:hypothetical protein